jgi:ABC-type uncharacterized transport system permease subunit
MTIGPYRLSLEKRVTLRSWQAGIISLLAIAVALLLFSVIFILAGVSPWEAYRQIFAYAFANPFGLPLTLNRFTFLLLCTCAFILPSRAGLWNIGLPGQAYGGAIGTFAVLALLAGGPTGILSTSPVLILVLMLIASALGGAAFGGVAGFLYGRFKVNEIVVTMMLNFVGFWLIAWMIKEGGPFMNSGAEGESFGVPAILRAPLLLEVPYTLLLALAVAVILYFVLAKTRFGYEVRAHGQSPAAARYAGISTFRIPLLVFLLGGAIAGWAGYHYFAAVPGVYKIPRNYGYFGDLAFYGTICGLISLGDPLAAIPVALLFGGLSVGGKFVQGALHIGFGVDYALLGVLMITLVASQFLYRYRIAWTRTGEEVADVGAAGQVP